MREHDACTLCLQKVRDPVACTHGHLFCKECVYTDLRTFRLVYITQADDHLFIVSQKKDIKKQKARLDALKKEAAEERLRAQADARERVLKEFERGQLGLGLGGSSVISTSGSSQRKEHKSKEDKDGRQEECEYHSVNVTHKLHKYCQLMGRSVNSTCRSHRQASKDWLQKRRTKLLRRLNSNRKNV